MRTLLRAEKQQSAEKGQKAQEEAEREYEEQKAKRDQQEQARIDKQIAKRATVVTNLDMTEGACGGFFASIYDTPPNTTKHAGCSLDGHGTGVPEGKTHDCQ